MKFIAVFLALSALAPMSAQTTGTEATIHKEDQHTIPKSDHTFTGNLTLASQYVFRGLTQTDGKAALQGGFDYSHANGFYIGTWLSNVSWYTDQNAGVASAPVALASPGSVGHPMSWASRTAPTWNGTSTRASRNPSPTTGALMLGQWCITTPASTPIPEPTASPTRLRSTARSGTRGCY